MRYSANHFIKCRIINLLMIGILSFFIGVAYLGFYTADIETIERVMQIEATPSKQ